MVGKDVQGEMVNVQAVTVARARAGAGQRSSRVVWTCQEALAVLLHGDALSRFHSQLHCLFSDDLCIHRSEERRMVDD